LIANVAESGCIISDVRLRLDCQPSLKLADGQLKLDFRDNQVRQFLQIIFDFQRLIGLPAMILIDYQNADHIILR